MNLVPRQKVESKTVGRCSLTDSQTCDAPVAFFFFLAEFYLNVSHDK